MQGIIKGIQAYFGAFKLMSKLKLWKYFFIPITISVVTAMVIGGFSYAFSDNLGDYIASFWSWEFGKETFQDISSIFGGFVIVAIGFLLFKHIILALSAPFMGTVSKKIEEYLLDRPVKESESSSMQLLIRGIRISIRNLFRELILTLPILLLGLIPLIGLLSTILLFLVQAYFAGFGNMDYTLERHFNYSKSVRFVKQNRGLATGNGLLFMLFLFIPFIGVILVLPFSVTAATIITVNQIQQEKKS